MDTPNEHREGGGDERVGKTPDVLSVEQGPLWWYVRLIEEPEALVEKAHTLLASERWEEVVVGLTVVTGRCVPEILKTGVLVPKKRYALLFAAYLERIDEVVGPFELPTLVEADLVLSAWKRVRSQISCTSLRAEEVCARYRPQVAAAARGQFAELVGVDAFADGYTPLLRQVYATIAARYYCPTLVDRSWFMDLVQGVERSEKDRCVRAQRCDACQRACFTYKIGNGAGNVDGSLGLKLELPGYDLLDCLKERDPGVEVEKPEGLTETGNWSEEEDDEDDRNVLALASQMVIVDKDGNIDTRRGIKLGEPGVEVLGVFKEPMTSEGEADENEDEADGEEEEPGEEAFDDDYCEMYVLDETKARFDQVAQQLGMQSDNETLVALIEIEVQRRGVVSQVMNRLLEEVKQATASKGEAFSEEEIDPEEDDDDFEDRAIKALIDTYEQQTYAVHLYLYDRLSQFLEPLAKELNTQTPLQTVRALMAVYREREVQEGSGGTQQR